MTPQEHYAEAERLLTEGARVVQGISAAFQRRNRLTENQHHWIPEAFERSFTSATREMDELGKKAMGIWAQAQVHATLATVQQSEITYATEVTR